MKRKSITPWLAGAIGLALIWSSGLAAAGHRKHHEIPAAFQTLLENSMQEKFGLTFFLNGQSLPAVVTKINDDGTVEGRSQQYGRIVIRLHRVNAIAKQ